MKDHFRTKHKDDPEVKNALPLPKKEMMRKLTILERRGDFEANMKYASETGKFLTVVRKSKDLDVRKYIPCINCHGLFSRKNLAKHLKNCEPAVGKSTTSDVKAGKMLVEGRLAKDEKFKHLKVLSRMVEDEVSNIIKNDEGILLYGYTLWEKCGQAVFNEISSKLRGTARLLLSYRKMNKVPDAIAFSLINPENWDSIIESVKCLVNHKDNEQVGILSLLLSVGKRAWGIKTKSKDKDFSSSSSTNTGTFI